MIYTEEEIAKIKESCRLVSDTLVQVKKQLRSGLTPIELDQFIEKYICSQGGKPAFKGYNGFPASSCISVNAEVVHGIPNRRKFKHGDIISVDIGVELDGFFGDSAYTFSLGKLPIKHSNLLKATLESLQRGVEAVKADIHTEDIGAAVQRRLEADRLAIIKALCGHGVGRSLHEDPAIPNYGKVGQGPVLPERSVIAIEPMASTGTDKVKILNDNWTIQTEDREPSAHFEHTVVVRANCAEVLTNFDGLC
jgi:methionyl aminopeptidase